MADFRLVRRLHAYSGGTVPDFNRISYSPSILHATDGTQAFMNLFIHIIRAKPGMSIVKMRMQFGGIGQNDQIGYDLNPYIGK